MTEDGHRFMVFGEGVNRQGTHMEAGLLRCSIVEQKKGQENWT